MNCLRGGQVNSPNLAVGITDKSVLQLTSSNSQNPVISLGSDTPGSQEVVHVCTREVTDIAGVGVALTSERRRSAINSADG